MGKVISVIPFECGVKEINPLNFDEKCKQFYNISNKVYNFIIYSFEVLGVPLSSRRKMVNYWNGILNKDNNSYYDVKNIYWHEAVEDKFIISFIFDNDNYVIKGLREWKAIVDFMLDANEDKPNNILAFKMVSGKVKMKGVSPSFYRDNGFLRDSIVRGYACCLKYYIPELRVAWDMSLYDIKFGSKRVWHFILCNDLFLLT